MELSNAQTHVYPENKIKMGRFFCLVSFCFCFVFVLICCIFVLFCFVLCLFFCFVFCFFVYFWFYFSSERLKIRTVLG